MPRRHGPSHRTLARPWHTAPIVWPGLRAFLARVPWRFLLLCLGLAIEMGLLVLLVFVIQVVLKVWGSFVDLVSIIVAA